MSHYSIDKSLIKREGNFDNIARQDAKQSKAASIYWWVVASFAYYQRDVSLLSDPTFDRLSKDILDNNIKHSLLSHLISESDLRAGSGYAIPSYEYPLFIVRDAENLISILER